MGVKGVRGEAGHRVTLGHFASEKVIVFILGRLLWEEQTLRASVPSEKPSWGGRQPEFVPIYERNEMEVCVLLRTPKQEQALQ